MVHEGYTLRGVELLKLCSTIFTCRILKQYVYLLWLFASHWQCCKAFDQLLRGKGRSISFTYASCDTKNTGSQMVDLNSCREASQTCSSPSSYQNVMVCEGEMGKRDEMVKKKSVGEIQRAYYEQWQNSKVRRTNRLQHSTYDKALNLNYFNCCVLNEAQ